MALNDIKTMSAVLPCVWVQIALYIRDLYLTFQLVRHRRRIAYHLRTIPTQDQPFCHGILVPCHLLRRRCRPMIYHAPYSRWCLVTESEILFVGILAKIEARPPSKQSQRAFLIPV